MKILGYSLLLVMSLLAFLIAAATVIAIIVHVIIQVPSHTARISRIDKGDKNDIKPKIVRVNI